MKNDIICSKCILTNNTPNIDFDENGVCNFCKTYVCMKVMTEGRLIEILNKFRTSNKKYDCMVGLSGGRDTTHVLWKLVKDYHMKVLAVAYDNPFASKQAQENIKNTTEILNVDVVKWCFPNDAHKRSTKKYLKIWSHHPSSSLIPFVCAYCKTWWPGFFNVARKNDI